MIDKKNEKDWANHVEAEEGTPLGTIVLSRWDHEHRASTWEVTLRGVQLTVRFSADRFAKPQEAAKRWYEVLLALANGP